MKIITLNAWDGRGGTTALLNFFKNWQDVDIFCLQEIFNGGENDVDEVKSNVPEKEYRLFTLITEALPTHQGFFRPSLKDFYGLAMFVKKNITIVEEGVYFVHQYQGYVPDDDIRCHARNIQYIKTEINGKQTAVMNFHGLWNGNGKTDTEDRIQQSTNILHITKNISENFVLCGDFNLLPDTKSIKMLEAVGLRNLIKEYGITSTRTSYYMKPDRYADYVFVTAGLEVTDFKALPEEVSDHAPLYTEVT
ncbi:unnamed protein product [Didymodactylos carnosus]|uniref:Endonuclease/exonuclease/phosphatase domain-containing protein n=1 Tax=Didymodactylos carnosus TaxID=1234261 RepID=A0A815UGX3_9BILA|nr:unnamed protein product [Didymodactylos carnosus]CAF4381644.1 unnamed protein product [Didymodactylos carnosus]